MRSASKTCIAVDTHSTYGGFCAEDIEFDDLVEPCLGGRLLVLRSIWMVIELCSRQFFDLNMSDYKDIVKPNHRGRSLSLSQDGAQKCSRVLKLCSWITVFSS